MEYVKGEKHLALFKEMLITLIFARNTSAAQGIYIKFGRGIEAVKQNCNLVGGNLLTVSKVTVRKKLGNLACHRFRLYVVTLQVLFLAISLALGSVAFIIGIIGIIAIVITLSVSVN